MPKVSQDKLVLLVNSLTSAEKRSFKVYVNRNKTSGDKLFVQLFDLIDKEKSIPEEGIDQKIPGLKKGQLSNLKANLYQQILTCLRLLKRKSSDDIRIREQIDFAKILYEKGLYRPCLDVLDKAKKQAQRINYETLVLSILYLEKRIESQHITGSMYPRAIELSNQSNDLLKEINLTNRLSNLSLQLYGEYLKNGHVKSKEEFTALTTFFTHALPDIEIRDLSFFQNLYYLQANVWYHNMIHDFLNYYKYSQKWVDLFEAYPEMLDTQKTLYIKGVHNVLNALFLIQNRDKFENAYQTLINIKDALSVRSIDNDVANWTLVYVLHTLNRTFLTAEYVRDSELLADIENIIEENRYNWDINRIMVFHYKVACIYFGSGKLEKSIVYLNKINNAYYPGLREDIQCFAKILNLIAHFDLGNQELVTYLVKSTYRFLSKLGNLQAVQREILNFLKRTPQMEQGDMTSEFLKLKDALSTYRLDRFEKRPFLYLDIISWLDSKIEGKPIQDIIQAKLITRNED